jgi:monofunctional biosynthetic peptidoglycan transglycosylase
VPPFAAVGSGEDWLHSRVAIRICTCNFWFFPAKSIHAIRPRKDAAPPILEDFPVSRRKAWWSRSHRWLRWLLRGLLIFLLLDFIYLASIWPDWKPLASGTIPKTSFMKIYEDKRASRGWGPMAWQPVPLARIPRHMIRAVIVAEDSRFYTHSGFDLIAIKEALDYNLDRGKLAIGASTISQQTVKNLYLSPSRNPLRKWHELFLTWGIEHNLRKSRILELYLNVVEFGRGIYGVQAAARIYYGVDVEQLNLVQVAELAATLPSPVKNNPATRSESFERRSQRILGLLTREQVRNAPPEMSPAVVQAEENPESPPERPVPAGTGGITL